MNGCWEIAKIFVKTVHLQFVVQSREADEGESSKRVHPRIAHFSKLSFRVHETEDAI